MLEGTEVRMAGPLALCTAYRDAVIVLIGIFCLRKESPSDETAKIDRISGSCSSVSLGDDDLMIGIWHCIDAACSLISEM
jgi:hypothetical protein